MKAEGLLAAVILLIAVYVGAVFYTIRTAHPFELLHVYTYGKVDWIDGGILPAPFIERAAFSELKRRPLESYRETSTFILAPDTILNFKDHHYYSHNEHWKKLVVISDLFLEKGMDIDEPNLSGCTSLKGAKISGDSYAEEYLVSRGASSSDESSCER